MTTQIDAYKPELSTICPYPVRRYAARAADQLLYAVLIWIFKGYVFDINLLAQAQGGGLLLDLVLSTLLFLLLEPLWLRFTGTTPGKAVFGIHLRSRSGGKLTFAEARTRTFDVWMYGMGFGVPLLNLYRAYKSFRICEENDVLQWDSDTYFLLTARFHYRHGRTTGIFIAVLAGSMAVSILLALNQMLPPNRGPLTVPEFTENYRYYQRYYGMDGGETYLNDEGRWIGRSSDESGAVIISLGYSPSLPFEFELEGGQIAKISFDHRLRTKKDAVGSFYIQRFLSSMAFIGAGENLLSIGALPGKLLDTFSEHPFEDYETAVEGVTIRESNETKGYEQLIAQEGFGFLRPKDNKDEYLYEFMFELIR